MHTHTPTCVVTEVDTDGCCRGRPVAVPLPFAELAGCHSLLAGLPQGSGIGLSSPKRMFRNVKMYQNIIKTYVLVVLNMVIG
jgi:hypothetical protein